MLQLLIFSGKSAESENYLSADRYPFGPGGFHKHNYNPHIFWRIPRSSCMGYGYNTAYNLCRILINHSPSMSRVKPLDMEVVVNQDSSRSFSVPLG